MIKIFFNHRYEFARIAHTMGFHIGTRADHLKENKVHKLLEEGIEISFVDNNFKNPNRDRLRKAARILNPNYVVLPDVFDATDFDTILDFGAELEAKDITPIIVPKDDFTFSDIPDDWIVGFSVPSGYGETSIPITAFDGMDVHLLGGSHRNQIDIADKAVENGVNIVSVDGNAFTKAATYGNVVNTPSVILDGGNAWHADVDGYDNWGQRITLSLVRYYELWRLWCKNHNKL